MKVDEERLGLTAQDGNSAAMASQACCADVRMAKERIKVMVENCIVCDNW